MPKSKTVVTPKRNAIELVILIVLTIVLVGGLLYLAMQQGFIPTRWKRSLVGAIVGTVPPVKTYPALPSPPPAKVLTSQEFWALEAPSVLRYASQTLAVASPLNLPERIRIADPADGRSLQILWDVAAGVTGANVIVTRRELTAAAPIGDAGASEIGRASYNSGVFVDLAVAANARYAYTLTVEAADGRTRSPQSAPLEVSVTDRTPPDAIALTVTPSANGVALSWVLPKGNDIARLLLYRSAQRGTLGDLIAAIERTSGGDGLGTTYTDTTAPSGTPLYYAAVAIDGAGNASAQTFLTSPEAAPAREQP